MAMAEGSEGKAKAKGAADADLAERLHRRNADLSEENARLASACNELAYRLVMTGVPVPPGLVDAAGHQPPRRAFPSSITLSPNRKGLAAVSESADVPSSAVGDDALRFLAAPDAGVSRSLRALCVADSQVTDAGIAALCAPHGADGDEPLCSRLEELDISGCKRVTDAALARLPLFRRLVVLDISRCGAGAVGIAATLRQPGALSALQVFRASGAVATDRVLTALGSQDRKLREVCLVDGGKALGDAAIAAFAASAGASLARADFAGSAAGDHAAAALAKCPKLQRLGLRGCSAVTNAGATSLAQAPALRELDLSGTACTSEAGHALAAGVAPLEAVALGGEVDPAAIPAAAPAAAAAAAPAPADAPAHAGGGEARKERSPSRASRKLEMEDEAAPPAPPHAPAPRYLELRKSVVAGFTRVQWVPAPGPGPVLPSSPKPQPRGVASFSRRRGPADHLSPLAGSRKAVVPKSLRR